jgi:hypothetical protein
MEPWVADIDADAVIQSALHDQDDGEAGEVRTALAVRQLCDAARRRDLPVASVIVSIERAWLRSIEVRRLPTRDARSVLDRLVTACLSAFYVGLWTDAAGK